jgi:hypothetical protein
MHTSARLFALACSIVMILVGLSKTVVESQAQPALQTPTAVDPSSLVMFPRNLFCADVEPIDLGSTWKSIVIGESSLAELQVYLDSLGNYSIQVVDDQEVGFWLEPPVTILDERAPEGVGACLNENVVTVLQLYTSPVDETAYIENFVAMYGIPDTVTWTSNDVLRLAFWFGKGVAVEAYIGESDYGRIATVTYFPIQERDDYQNRWPYNRTRSENFPIQGMGLPDGEQNPFDFEAMLNALTAEAAVENTPTMQPTVAP